MHFNDVYDIESGSREPVGGASRFVTKVKQLKESNTDDVEPIVVFSGDALSPSLLSTMTKGKQMVPILNSCQIEVACMGNHDFDFGVENLEKLVSQTKFPWLLSNVKFIPTNRNLAEGKSFHTIHRGGRKIGFMGLVEWEWMQTLSTIDEHDIEYEDFIIAARRLAKILREKEKCDVVIALTHMRVPNDEKLARECGDILDLICGGHDHHYDVKKIAPHDCYLLKSGTDFRDLTTVKMQFHDDPITGKCTVTIPDKPEHEVIDSRVEEDKETKEVVDSFLSLLGSEMEKVIGFTNVSLEARFQKVRTQETNLGNFVADVMRRGTSADVCILNSGTLRADCVMPAGDLKMKDLVSISPMIDENCTILMNGDQLKTALENGVSQYPRLEGRFPQVSGVEFSFDASLPPKSRILPGMKVNGVLVTPESTFKVCTKAYLAKGKDGYDVFAECEVLVNEEDSPILPTLLRNTFQELNIINGFKPENKGGRKHSVLVAATQWRRQTFKATPDHVLDMHSKLEDLQQIAANAADGVNPSPRKALPTHGIHPEVEGRILCINPVDIAGN